MQCRSCGTPLDDLKRAESLVSLIKLAKEARLEHPALWAAKNGPRCDDCLTAASRAMHPNQTVPPQSH